MSLIVPTCPTNCGATLPDTSFDDCNPNIGFGEIEAIYVQAANADPLVDWEIDTEWLAAMGLAVSDSNAMRRFDVIADLPAAAADEVIISKGRKVYSPATHTINLDIDDISPENYEFARVTSCNLQFIVRFATKQWMYGGNDGILAMMNLRPVIERGQKSINKISGTITWDAQFSPERAAAIF